MVMSLRGKLHLGLAVMLVLTLGTGGVAIWAVGSWQSATDELVTAHAQGLLAQRVVGDLYRQIKELLDRVVTDDPDAGAEFAELGGGVQAAFNDLYGHARSAEERQRIRALQDAHRTVVDVAGRIFEHLERGKRAEALELMEEELERVAFRQAEKEVQALQAFYRSASEQSVQRNLAIGRFAKAVSASAILLASLSAVGLGLAVRQWFIRPLDAISRSTATISTGDLDHRVPVHTRDELGRLATSINEMARALKAIQEQLVQAERLAALGELSSYIAHNIRNPLASIRSAAQVGMQETTDPEGRETFGDIIHAADRLEHWVQQLLSYTRPLSLERRRYSLNRMIEGCLDLYQQPMTDKALMPLLELDPDLPEIILDPELMEQVVAAILANAVEASPPGGRIIMQTALAAEGNGSQAVIRITDEGEGIAPELLDQVFHPYFTTKTNGIGLGLAMARKIVEQHRGRITLASGPGRGTVAEITLPLIPDGAGHHGENPDY
ncbi:MAG: ATP-binding protein [Candidatus Methylomirabilales bacterium]